METGVLICLFFEGFFPQSGIFCRLVFVHQLVHHFDTDCNIIIIEWIPMNLVQSQTLLIPGGCILLTLVTLLVKCLNLKCVLHVGLRLNTKQATYKESMHLRNTPLFNCISVVSL